MRVSLSAFSTWLASFVTGLNQGKTCAGAIRIWERTCSGLWGPAAPLGPVVAPLVPRCALLPAPTPRLMGLRPPCAFRRSEAVGLNGALNRISFHWQASLGVR